MEKLYNRLDIDYISYQIEIKSKSIIDLIEASEIYYNNIEGEFNEKRKMLKIDDIDLEQRISELEIVLKQLKKYRRADFLINKKYYSRINNK